MVRVVLDGRAIALRLGYGHADSMSMHLKHVVDVRVEPGLRVHLLVNNLTKLAERESNTDNRQFFDSYILLGFPAEPKITVSPHQKICAKSGECESCATLGRIYRRQLHQILVVQEYTHRSKLR